VPPKLLNIIGVDPGKVTGWALWKIPRESMYSPGGQSGIIERYSGEIRGRESDQVIKLCRFFRTVQSLDYKVGPAVICESFDFGSPLSDPEVYSPVRIASMLKLMFEQPQLKQVGDARLVMQGRTIAKKTATDERLKAWGLWKPASADHERDAERHIITALRRAKQKREFRDRLWDRNECIIRDGDR
jgi:hypothetical protein